MKLEYSPSDPNPNNTDDFVIEDLMRTSTDVAKGKLITGSETPTTRSRIVPLGIPPVGEQILDALIEGDDEAARKLHEHYPTQPNK